VTEFNIMHLMSKSLAVLSLITYILGVDGRYQLVLICVLLALIHAALLTPLSKEPHSEQTKQHHARHSL
jgi:hypothetical protein